MKQLFFISFQFGFRTLKFGKEFGIFIILSIVVRLLQDAKLRFQRFDDLDGIVVFHRLVLNVQNDRKITFVSSFLVIFFHFFPLRIVVILRGKIDEEEHQQEN